MTEPDDMTDGELSEAVAVEVMGWVDDTKAGGAPETTWAFWREPDQPCGDRYWQDAPPAYATDIAAAMEVFEKVGKALNGSFIIEQRTLHNATGQAGPGLVVGIIDYGGDDKYRWGCNPDTGSLPRRVCEAALLWARSRPSTSQEPQEDVGSPTGTKVCPDDTAP